MKKIALTLISILILSIFIGCISVDDNQNNAIVFEDSDKDNVSDKVDAFPDDPAASIDTDGDGYPNSWNPGKNQGDSTSDPPLELDELKNNPNEWKDTDGDKVGDNSDVFPTNPAEWSDLDSDGIGDNADINPTADLSVSVSINKFKVTRRVDLLKWAQIYFKVKINGNENKLNNGGKLWRVWLNEEKSIQHDPIIYDIPDDTTQSFTEIEITMYDHDLLKNDDILNLDQFSTENSIIFRFDNKKNSVEYEKEIYGVNAILWLEIKNSAGSIPDNDIYTKTYNWNYDHKNWEVTIDIPADTYKNYLDSSVDRDPQNQGNSDAKMAAFVTTDEKVIDDLSDKLYNLAKNNGYDSVETINFILGFVQDQGNIRYIGDNDTKGQEEYWRYPVETLVENQGDCEDTSVLFSSIMEILRYDTAILFYAWEKDEEKIGHLAVGIHLLGDHGHYVKDDSGSKYYYCETTTSTYKIGQLPPDIEGEPKKVIPI